MSERGGAFAPVTLAVALAAGWLIPGHALGIGIVLVWGLLLVSVSAAPTVTMTLGRGATFTAAFVLATAAAWRDASWVVVPALVVSIVLVSIAVREARSMREVAWAGVVPLRLISGARTSLEHVRARIQSDVYERIRPLARGLMAGGALLVVFGTFFLTADRAFAHYAEQIFAVRVDVGLLPARSLVALIAFATSGALIRQDPWIRPMERWHPDADGWVLPESVPAHPSRPMPEWVTPLGLLALLFAAFVAVQFAVLFGGNRHVLDTAGLTYAEYARAGFFQLLAVAALTVVVVGAARRLVVVGRSAERYLLEGLLTSLCLLTLVILASALYRLQVYEDAYGFTRARFTARVTMFWVAAVLLMMLVRGWRPSFGRHLVTAIVAATAVAVLGLAVVNPDALIARGNVDRFERSGRVDVSYLSTLSADAVPELLRLPEPYRSCALANVHRGSEPWPAANLARARARALLPGVPLGDERCWSLDT